ncbi:hypothetical protein SAMN04489712_10668 [Thermomonospora echinospora]|uniref:Uncharacterized protein n=1 Tax=Thermomonospora echinospora TaxID=1992 RepID=A0A1H6AWN3_9ACTN|nr:hypothetical protein SAMN04489712_10668 [Thermomonospora echinospora]
MLFRCAVLGLSPQTSAFRSGCVAAWIAFCVMGLPPLDERRGRRVLAGLARNPSVPEKVLLRLIHSSAACAVASRRADITEALAGELLGSEDVEVALPRLQHSPSDGRSPAAGRASRS